MAKNSKKQECPVSCPRCGKVLGLQDMLTVFEKNTRTLWHFTCPGCQTSALIRMIDGTRGVVGLGVVTDLDRAEIKEKFFAQSVSTDEVIEAYQMIKDYGRMNREEVKEN